MLPPQPSPFQVFCKPSQQTNFLMTTLIIKLTSYQSAGRFFYFSSKLGDNLQTQVEPIHEAGVNLDQRIDTKDPRVVAAAYKEYLMSKQLLQASEPDLAVIRSSL